MRSNSICIPGLLALAIAAGGQGDPLRAADAAKSPQQAEAEGIAAAARPLAEAGKWDEAIAAAEKALKIDEKCPLALYVRGRGRQGKGQLDEAIRDFEAVTGQGGRDPALVALRADAFAKRSAALHAQGKHLQAIDSAYFGILEKNDHFECHLNRGLAYLARHEWEKAARSFEKAVQANPKSAAAISHRGFANGARGYYDWTIGDQNRAIELDPKLAIAYERRAAARITKALKSAKPNLKDATTDVAKALELDPHLPEALCDRAFLAGLAGDLKKAAADADAAVAAAPKLARAHLTRGMIHAHAKEPEAAIRSFDAAIEIDPKLADALAGRGQARLAAKDYAAAIADFNRVIELDPASITALQGRAAARRKQAAAKGTPLEGSDLEAVKADTAKAKELEEAIAKKADAAKWKDKDKDKGEKPPAFTDDSPRLALESKPVDPARLPQALKSARQIDKLVAAGLAAHKVEPMPRTTDAQFVRRIYLDVVGTIPTYKQTTAFLASTDPDKRVKLVDELLGSDGYASHFFNYWADILRYRDRLSEDVRGEPYRQWIKKSLAENKPWDRMVSEMLTAEGLIWENPATGYLQRDPGMPLDNVNNTVRIFLGTRIGCAQCHNHPFDKWTQKQFYQTAAFVFPTQTQTYGGDKRFWPEDPGKRLREEYSKIEQEEEDRRQRSYQFDAHLRVNMKIVNENLGRKVQLPKDYAYSDAKPGDVVPPKTLFGPDIALSPGDSPRKAFARWLTSKDNPRFALTIANRLWKQVFGVGQIEPVDDMMDSTVAENPELMKFLEAEMKRLDFDMKEFLRILLNTETYQRQACDQELLPGTPYHFPGPILRRMTAEQAWDSFLTLAIAPLEYREPPADLYREAAACDLAKDPAEKILAAHAKVGEIDRMRSKTQDKYKYKGNLLARASELPAPVPANHFLRMFGQSDRELIAASSTAASVPQVLFMFNGQISHMLLEKNSTIYNNIVKKKSVGDGVRVVFLTILNREPDAEELALATKEVRSDGPAGYGNVVWSLVNTREFMFIQ